ncbi:MAG TPA: GAF domain-containing protein, partial [Chloroflexota bacterium]
VLERVAQLALERSGALLGCDRALGFWVSEPSRRELVLVAHHFRRPASAKALRRISLEASALEARAAITAQPQWVERAEALLPALPSSHAIARDEGVEGILALPLEGVGEVVGVLTCAWQNPHTPTSEERQVADLLAGLLATGVRAARRYAEAERRARDLAALQEITEVGLAGLQLEPLLQELLQRSRRLTGADVAIIYLFQEEAGELVVRKAVGVSSAEMADLRVRAGQGLAGQVFARNEPLVVPDIQAQPHLQSPYMAAHGIRSALGVPLRARGRLIGVGELAFKRPREFDAEDVRLLEVMAERAALAIENARLYQETLTRARELAEARRRLELFMGVVAHDLRAPLTAIRGYAQLLRRPGALADRQRDQALRGIDEQVGQMLRLIEDLLNVSRVLAGRLPLALRPTDLVALTRKVVEAQQVTTTRHRIILEAPDRIEGQWDPERLTQLLTNLINNAIKYSPEGGNIWVRLRATDDSVELDVVDQGIGMAPETLEVIFRPFVRIERTRTLRGAGLGLFIAKQIVEAHGGRIWASSPGPGKGSTFSVVLPRWPHAPSPSTRNKRPSAAAPSRER